MTPWLRAGSSAVALALVLAAASASAQTPAPFLLAKTSLVRIETSDGTGSGFAVTRALVATNCHVVKGASAIQLHFWAAKVRVPGRQVVCDDKLDVAYLAVAVPDGTTTLEFSADQPVQGQQVWVWGFPLGTTIATEPVLSTGIISATESAQGFITIDASGAPGSSGGPVVNADGKVIAIFTGNWMAGRQGPTGFKAGVTAANASTVLARVANLPPPTGGATARTSEATVRPGDGVGVLKLGMTPAQAEAALGLPPSSRSEDCSFWSTRKLGACFDRGKIQIILTEDPSDIAPGGIRVGSTDVDLITAYGRPRCSRISSLRGRAYLTWYYEGLAGLLDGDPRRILGLIVWPPGATSSFCG